MHAKHTQLRSRNTMNSYIQILQDLLELWQQLKKLELSNSQKKEALYAKCEQIIKSNLDFPLYKTSYTNPKKKAYAKGVMHSYLLHPLDEWISVSKAAEISCINKGVISRLASEGLITSNGKKGRGRKLLKSTVLLVKQDREDREELKEAREEKNKIKAIEKHIPDQH